MGLAKNAITRKTLLELNRAISADIFALDTYFVRPLYYGTHTSWYDQAEGQ